MNIRASLCLLLLTLIAPIAHAQTRLLTADYETGTVDSGIPKIETTAATAPDAVFMATEGARNGAYSVGHKVMLNNPAYVSYGKPRSETATDHVLPAHYVEGDHRIYTFSVLLKDWEAWNGVNRAIDIIWQFHRNQSAADIFVGVRRNQMVIRYGNQQIAAVDDVQANVNKWIDFRFDILWKRDATGYFIADVRLDGEPNYTRKATVLNYPTFDPASTGAFGVIQWGLYRPDSTIAGGSPLTRIDYHDDITVTELPPRPPRL